MLACREHNSICGFGRKDEKSRGRLWRRKERESQEGSLVPPAAGLQVSGSGSVVAKLACVLCRPTLIAE